MCWFEGQWVAMWISALCKALHSDPELPFEPAHVRRLLIRYNGRPDRYIDAESGKPRL
jgi:hypothetical protein